MDNFINTYNENEKKEFSKIPFSERILYVSEILKDYNIDKINNENELCFNVCREHIGRSEFIINNLCNGLDQDDINSITLINNKIAELGKNWHYKVVPNSSLFMHLYQKKLINHFFPNAKKILEIGPGSGYLTILLAKLNKTLYSTEIFQPHYIYQNFLYKQFSNLQELVTKNDLCHDENTINHIPWWKLDILQKENFEINLAIMNHMIVEMNINSLRKILSILNKFNNPKILIESTGRPKYNSWSNTKKILEAYGYKMIFSGGHFSESRKTYIFEKSEFIKHTFKMERIIPLENKTFLKKIINIFPFQKEILCFINYLIDNIKNFLKKIFFISRYEKNIKNYRIFQNPSQFFYNDIKKLYDKNNWNIKNLDEKFFDKINPKQN